MIEENSLDLLSLNEWIKNAGSDELVVQRTGNERRCQETGRPGEVPLTMAKKDRQTSDSDEQRVQGCFQDIPFQLTPLKADIPPRLHVWIREVGPVPGVNPADQRECHTNQQDHHQ